MKIELSKKKIKKDYILQVGDLIEDIEFGFAVVVIKKGVYAIKCINTCDILFEDFTSFKAMTEKVIDEGYNIYSKDKYKLVLERLEEGE